MSAKKAPPQGCSETVEKVCHCEPVRAAKQVPLGYTLARQSVSKWQNGSIDSLSYIVCIYFSHRSPMICPYTFSGSLWNRSASA